MNCPYCGCSNLPGTAFCSSCGAALSDQQSGQSYDNNPEPRPMSYNDPYTSYQDTNNPYPNYNNPQPNYYQNTARPIAAVRPQKSFNLKGVIIVVVLLAIAAAVLIPLINSMGTKNEIVGTWVNNSEMYGTTITTRYTFNKDGTFNASVSAGGISQELKGTYSIDSSKTLIANIDSDGKTSTERAYYDESAKNVSANASLGESDKWCISDGKLYMMGVIFTRG